MVAIVTSWCSWRSILLSGSSVNDRVRQDLRKLLQISQDELGQDIEWSTLSMNPSRP
jgi:hypothetical protein